MSQHDYRYRSEEISPVNDQNTQFSQTIQLTKKDILIINLTKNNYFLDERINWKNCAALGRFSSMSLEFIT